MQRNNFSTGEQKGKKSSFSVPLKNYSFRIFSLSSFSLLLHYPLELRYVENSSETNPANHEIFGIENIALKSSKSASNILLNEFQKPSNKWQTLNENRKKEIDTYLNNEIQNSNLDQRVVKMMMKLKEDSEIKENKI